MSKADSNPHEGESPFQSHLALGLHAFAQPLAVLRAKLYTESIARMDAGQLSQLAHDSAAHVERLCTLFSYLQEIVLAESADSSPMRVPVREVLEHVVDGLELWFQDTGLTLSLEVGEPVTEVLADRAKLSQAISSLVLLAHGQSKPGETVTIKVQTVSSEEEIVVSNALADVNALHAEGRLSLALVETILRRQGGSFAYTLQPLSFHARVPHAPIAT